MADNEKAKTLYEDIVNCSSFAKLQRIASQLSELIHCHKHRKVGDGYVLSILCAMRNAIWDSEDSGNSNWHTGTPTEGGLYVIAFRFGNKIEHEIREMFYSPDYGMTFGIKKDIVAWQKIEPYRG